MSNYWTNKSLFCVLLRINFKTVVDHNLVWFHNASLCNFYHTNMLKQLTFWGDYVRSLILKRYYGLRCLKGIICFVVAIKSEIYNPSSPTQRRRTFSVLRTSVESLSWGRRWFFESYSNVWWILEPRIKMFQYGVGLLNEDWPTKAKTRWPADCFWVVVLITINAVCYCELLSS